MCYSSVLNSDPKQKAKPTHTKSSKKQKRETVNKKTKAKTSGTARRQRQAAAVIIAFFAVSFLLLWPSPQNLFGFSVVSLDESLMGELTKGDFLLFYGLLGTTISVMTFVWVLKKK